MFTIGEKDKKGPPVLWYRPELLKNSEGGPQRERNKRLSIYYIEKMDRQFPREGWNFGDDCSRMTKENVDMDIDANNVPSYVTRT